MSKEGLQRVMTITKGQTTHHETDIISYFTLVAMGDANITNELWIRFSINRPPGWKREHTSGAKG